MKSTILSEFQIDSWFRKFDEPACFEIFQYTLKIFMLGIHVKQDSSWEKD